MNLDPIRLIIAVCLAIYGIYIAGLALSMTAAPPITFTFFFFLIEAVLAIVAAFGVGRSQSWAPAAVLILGIVVAVRWLYQGFILGIVAYLYALMMALLAVVAALAVAAYLSGRWRVDISKVGSQPSRTM
jgi:hypothetical protein